MRKRRSRSRQRARRSDMGARGFRRARRPRPRGGAAQDFQGSGREPAQLRARGRGTARAGGGSLFGSGKADGPDGRAAGRARGAREGPHREHGERPRADRTAHEPLRGDVPAALDSRLADGEANHRRDHRESTRVDRYILLLRDGSRGLRVAIADDPEGYCADLFLEDTYQGGDCMVDAALKEGRIFMNEMPGSRAVAAVPLRMHDDTVGVLVLLKLLDHKHDLTDRDRDLLELLGHTRPRRWFSLRSTPAPIASCGLSRAWCAWCGTTRVPRS